MSRREALEPLSRAHRDAGMGYAAIARTLGVPKGTIIRWLNPDYEERQRAVARAWKARNTERKRQYDREYGEAHRLACQNPACGRLCGRHWEVTYCASCRQAIADVRRTLGEGMWADGWLVREIADAFGVTKAYIAVMRSEGWDLPYRRSPEDVAAITAGARRGRGL